MTRRGSCRCITESTCWYRFAWSNPMILSQLPRMPFSGEDMRQSFLILLRSLDPTEILLLDRWSYVTIDDIQSICVRGAGARYSLLLAACHPFSRTGSIIDEQAFCGHADDIANHPAARLISNPGPSRSLTSSSPKPERELLNCRLAALRVPTTRGK